MKPAGLIGLSARQFRKAGWRGRHLSPIQLMSISAVPAKCHGLPGFPRFCFLTYYNWGAAAEETVNIASCTSLSSSPLEMKPRHSELSFLFNVRHAKIYLCHVRSMAHNSEHLDSRCIRHTITPRRHHSHDHHRNWLACGKKQYIDTFAFSIGKQEVGKT